MRSLSADLSDWEVEEALCDLRAGQTMEAVATRCGISTKTLTRTIRRADRREKEEEMSERKVSTPRRVNDALLAELERLEGIDLGSPDELRLEISRARAVEGIAKAATENVNTIMAISRARAEQTWATSEPITKMLAG